MRNIVTLRLHDINKRPCSYVPYISARMHWTVLSVVHCILPNPIITDTGKTAWFLSRCAITDGVAVMLCLFWFWLLDLTVKTTNSKIEKKTNPIFSRGRGGGWFRGKSNKMMKIEIHRICIIFMQFCTVLCTIWKLKILIELLIFYIYIVFRAGIFFTYYLCG